MRTRNESNNGCCKSILNVIYKIDFYFFLTMSTIQILEGHTDPVYSLTVWNNHLYSGSEDKTIRKWG